MTIRLTGLALVTVVLGGVACNEHVGPHEGEDVKLVRIDIQPAAISVGVGATQQFFVAATYSDSSTGPVDVVWSTANGTIGASGLYTAPSTAGSYKVIATSGSLADTAAVTVSAAPITLTKIDISPASATLGVSATQQFTILGTYSNNSTGTPAVTWSAIGGSITASGLYTARATAGSYSVIASAGAVADTAPITVSAPSTVSDSGAGPNEPAGFIKAVANPFNALPPHNPTVDAFGFSEFFGTHALSIVNDGTSPASPSTFIRNLFPGPTGGTAIPGTGGNGTFTRTSGTWTANAEIGKRYYLSGINAGPYYSSHYFTALVTGNTATTLQFAGDATGATESRGWAGGDNYINTYIAGTNLSATSIKKKLYIRIRYRLSANWTDNGNTGTKFFFFATGAPGGGASVNHYVGLTEGGAFQPAVNLQSTFGYATPSGANHRIPTPISKGAWHDLEILLIANTPGVYNGIAKIWVDGNLMVDATDMGYFAADNVARFDELYFNPTYGGGTNPIPADQWLDIDHWYISTAP